MEHLLQRAHQILELNWQGSFTIPTHKLYPFQWNWDSGFICLGHQYRNPRKAIQELNSLFSGQWENGLLPHIIFHSENEQTYFPNFDFWHSQVNTGAPSFPKSSGITQPAVHGFVLESLLFQNITDYDVRAFAQKIFPKILNFHRFLYQYRDPNREGLMFIFHPWESGRDNSPLWDESLNRIQIRPGDIPQYERKDINIANPSERPTTEQYDRYVYLLELGKRHRYDGPEIAEESPFLIQDDMMNAILIRSNQGLIAVGKELNLDTSEIEEWQTQSIRSFQSKFWNESLGMFTSYDLRAYKQIEEKEIGGVVPLFAHVATKQQAASIHDYLLDLQAKNYYLTPTFDVDSAQFDSKRYWRGPIWPHMNWMIARGLSEYGYDSTAERVRQDTLLLIEKFGFFEYFEPRKQAASLLTKGYGGDMFSWTASTVIDFILRNE